MTASTASLAGGFSLRPYQIESINALRSNVAAGVKAQVLQLATGGGKTQIASSIAQSAVAKGNRVFFIVDSIELVDQALGRFEADGMRCGVIQGQHFLTDYSKQVQVGTIQTLRSRWEYMPEDLKPGVLIVDECHVMHQAHEQIIRECKHKNIPVIGLSATPFRKGMGQVFDELVVGATTASLTEQGYLVPAVCYAPFVPELKGVKTTTGGDWQADALGELMGDAKIVGDVVDNWLKLAEGRQTIVFAANVGHSRLLCDAFQARGIRAAHIDGYERDPEVREQVISDFRAGRITVLTNCMILTKGFDAPETSCVVLARPTKSLMLHIQAIGRGLRIAPGKQDCIARDTEILTDRGLVKVQNVTDRDRVWDGAQFVRHSGAVCKGVQKVITYAGLTATPDHEVMTNDGWKKFAEAADRQLRIVESGFGGKPIRVAGDFQQEDRGCQLESVSGGEMPELRGGDNDALSQYAQKAGYESLQNLQSEKAGQCSEVAVPEMPSTKGQVREPAKSFIRALRRAWDKVQLFLRERSRSLDIGKPWDSVRQKYADRQNGQLRSLRAWELAVGQSCLSAEQYSPFGRFKQGEIRPLQAALSGNQVCRQNAIQDDFGGHGGWRNHREVLYAIEQTEREVWDIHNAGPLQRYTANGLLVHNCIVIDHAGNVLRNGLPTDELPAELDDGKIDRNLDRKKREEREPIPAACASCGHVSTQHKCPVCGFAPQSRKDVEVIDGELYEVKSGQTKQIKPDELKRLYAELLGYAHQRGFRSGWAWHKCREFAGRAPRDKNSIAPVQPSQRTLNIIKHLQIKNAKRRVA